MPFLLEVKLFLQASGSISGFVSFGYGIPVRYLALRHSIFQLGDLLVICCKRCSLHQSGDETNAVFGQTVVAKSLTSSSTRRFRVDQLLLQFRDISTKQGSHFLPNQRTLV